MKSTVEVNGAFIDRIVTGKAILPRVVAEVMKEVAEDTLVPIMKQAAPWLPDGTEGPVDSPRKTWIVSGMSRDFVAFVPNYIEPVMHYSSFVDKFHHAHIADRQLLQEASGGADAYGQVRLIVARYANYTPYLQAMERGELGGFGTEGPPLAWDKLSPDVIEIEVLKQNSSLFWQIVMQRLKERMIAITGARGGFIW